MTKFGPSLASIDALAERTAAEPTVWLRLVRCRDALGSWTLRALEVTAGEPSPRWHRSRWTYPEATFDAFDLAGERVAEWLRSRQVGDDHGTVTHQAMTESFRWQRQPSKAGGQFERLPWPTAEASFLSLSGADPGGPMVADGDAPSFGNFQLACASFLGIEPRPGGIQLPTSAMIRWQDTRARLNRVRIRPDELTVEVEGDHTQGFTVELAGDTPGVQQTLPIRSDAQPIQVMHFSVPNGIPAGAWILVRHGSELLDRRTLPWPWGGPVEAGVEVEFPPQDKIDAYLAGRENDTVEFKRQLPADDASKARVMKTVSAFANGAGGTVLFGINDDHDVVGFPQPQASRLIDQLGQLIRDWVEPTPVCSFELLEISDSDDVIIELTVLAGARLYGCSKPNEPRRIYVRHYARTVPARVGEVEEIVRHRESPVASSWMPRR